MIDYRRVDELAQFGRGVAGDIIGEPFDVYRLSDGSDGRAPSQGSIINDTSRVYKNFHIRVVRINAAVAIEGTPINDMCFQGMCDGTKLQVGDIVARSEQYRNTRELFAVAQLRPFSFNVFVRVEAEATLTRQWGRGNSDQVLGYVPYQGVGKYQERPYILKNGYYYIADNEEMAQGVSPAVIPIGIQPYKRMGPTPEIKQPTTTHRTEMFLYAPLLPGQYIEPSDIISDQNGNRYKVHTVHVQTVGLAGYQLIAESLFV